MYRKFILIFLSVFSFTYAVDEIENKYIRESSISETFLKEIIFNFSKHYGRQGIPELYKI